MTCDSEFDLYPAFSFLLGGRDGFVPAPLLVVLLRSFTGIDCSELVVA